MCYPKAVICEVMCLRDQEIMPTVSAYTRNDGSLVSKPIEDMYPFLDREEFRKQMLVKPIPE
jgi:acetolactate synthase-1/2/3 large subunit